MEDMIYAKKVDAIVLCPVDSDAIGTATLEANEAGIPVVTVDIRSNEGDVLAHVASDNKAIGEQAAKFAEEQLAIVNWKVDTVFSHTCPYKYRPLEAMIHGIDQSTIDTTTEEWLDLIEDKLDYKKWYCGHWHINKRIDKMEFLFHDVRLF